MLQKIDADQQLGGMSWPATRDEGLTRLSRFLAQGGSGYATQRNYDRGPCDRRNVSVLSPYIRHRLITEEEVVRQIVSLHGLRAAEKFVHEVCWRTYWKGWLEMRPAVWRRYGDDIALFNGVIAEDRGLRRRLDDAEGGRTGLACFDAWVEELVTTGYLHNHARMWFASIWIYTLGLPWQLGARFFMQHLLDGDPASNTLSWRWMCGLHTAGKTYLARPENIATYTGGRFPAPQGLAVIAPPAAEAVAVEKPIALTPRPTVLSGPNVDGEVTLLVTEEDLHPESWPFGPAKVRSIILVTSSPSNHDLSEQVQKFKALAMHDAGTRLARHFWCPAQAVDTADTDAESIILQACADSTALVMAEMPVGPVRTAVSPLVTALGQRGVHCVALRRPWDNALWPYATSGFFKFKDAIPAVLERLNIVQASQRS